MSRRLKLGLGWLGFLIINGSVLPTVGINWNVFKPLEGISQRGGQFWLKEETRKKEKDLKLVLPNSNFIDINLPKDNIQLSDIKLELKNESQLEIPSDSFNYSPKDHISGIFQEIQKENKVTGIEQSAKQKFENLVKGLGNLKQHASTFKGVKQTVISKWTKVKNALSRRKDNNPVPALKKEEKQNLKKMYQVFINLQESKKNLFQKFKEFDVPIASKSGEERESRDLRKTVESLDWLGWEQDFMRLEKNRGPFGGAFSNNWGSWKNNPYSNFYDTEDEFNRDIEFVNKMITRIDWQIRGLRDRMNWDNRRAEQLQSRISFFQDLRKNNYPQKHIVMRVAEKLLEHMGQLN